MLNPHSKQARALIAALAAVVIGGVAIVAVASGTTRSRAAGDTAKASSSAGKVRIAEFYYNPSPYGIASYKSALNQAKKLGVTVTTFNGNNTPQTQTTQMTDAITTGKYQAFWVWALDGVAIAPTIKQAEAKGIKVAVADYTLGDLNSQVTLKPTKGLVSTIGGSIGKQEKAFVQLIRLACAKQVGASGTCNVAFMPGLANYPTDTLREQYMQQQFASSKIHLTL